MKRGGTYDPEFWFDHTQFMRAPSPPLPRPHLGLLALALGHRQHRSVPFSRSLGLVLSVRARGPVFSFGRPYPSAGAWRPLGTALRARARPPFAPAGGAPSLGPFALAHALLHGYFAMPAVRRAVVLYKKTAFVTQLDCLSEAGVVT